jgi:hypothetical protein
VGPAPHLDRGLQHGRCLGVPSQLGVFHPVPRAVLDKRNPTPLGPPSNSGPSRRHSRTPTMTPLHLPNTHVFALSSQSIHHKHDAPSTVFSRSTPRALPVSTALGIALWVGHLHLCPKLSSAGVTRRHRATPLERTCIPIYPRHSQFHLIPYYH